MSMPVLDDFWEHLNFANYPQTRSLGLYKLSPPARTQLSLLQAGFVYVAVLAFAFGEAVAEG